MNQTQTQAIHEGARLGNGPDNLRTGLIHQTPDPRNEKGANSGYQGPLEGILMSQPEVTLGKIVRFYKARTTKLIHEQGHPKFHWHRNYYEHVIRNETDLEQIREYIVYNHLKWVSDRENPARADAGGRV